MKYRVTIDRLFIGLFTLGVQFYIPGFRFGGMRHQVLGGTGGGSEGVVVVCGDIQDFTIIKKMVTV